MDVLDEIKKAVGNTNGGKFITITEAKYKAAAAVAASYEICTSFEIAPSELKEALTLLCSKIAFNTWRLLTGEMKEEDLIL